MKRFLVFLMLVSVTLAQKPAPPFVNPNDPDDPALKLEYKGELTVPKNGKVVIPFTPAPFGQEPSCSFEGGTLPGERPRITNYYVTLKAKPRKKMKYECKGIRDSGSQLQKERMATENKRDRANTRLLNVLNGPDEIEEGI